MKKKTKTKQGESKLIAPSCGLPGEELCLTGLGDNTWPKKW